MRGFNNRFSDGKLDDVRIYDHALTAAEVFELNQVPVPEPSSAVLLVCGLVLGRRCVMRRNRN